MTADDELAARAQSRVGTTMRKYRIDRLLGLGGMATVFAGRHRNGNKVAIKILHRELLIDADVRARFLREGYLANAVEHRGVVRVLDDDVAEDGSVFLVMELLDGETLDARWARSGRRLGAREVASLIDQVLDVLAAAHAKGIVHRDIKPENLFLTDDGTLKVLDFGIARLREGSATATRSGSVFGTPAYMAPEQVLGQVREVDAQSDVWSVGATAFTLLSGHHLHEAETGEALMVYTASRPARSLATVAPGVPRPIVDVVDRALAFEKKDRWPSARAMQEAFARASREAFGPSSHAPDAHDDQTKVTPPPAMPPIANDRTMPLLRGDHGEEQAAGARGGSALVTEAMPTIPASTIAGVVSNSEARQVRQRRRSLALAAGGVSALLVAIVVTAVLAAGAISSKGGAKSAAPTISVSPTIDVSIKSAPSATLAGATSAERPVSLDSLPQVVAPAVSVAPPPRDAAPTRTAAATPAGAATRPPTPPARDTPPPALSTRRPKRDPLAP